MQLKQLGTNKFTEFTKKRAGEGNSLSYKCPFMSQLQTNRSHTLTWEQLYMQLAELVIIFTYNINTHVIFKSNYMKNEAKSKQILIATAGCEKLLKMLMEILLLDLC